ncbi:MAG TPA: NfeD family protein, partial [Pyrinomonadaceae bacterium]|nr:NfeD family protein [Pyrinomonadaceae bacterium]
DMDQIVPLLWVLLGVVLIVAEIFTLGFVLFWFGVGAIVAGLAGYLGLGVGLQFLIFAAVSIGLTVMSRTIFSNYLPQNNSPELKTGIESLPGRVGTVAEASRGALGAAAVKVYGSTWTAYPVEGESELAEGDKVEVVEVKGSSLYVRKVTNQLPEWRSD